MRLKDTALVGHYHRISSHPESNECNLVNWLLYDLEPAYAAVNERNHGFAIITVDKDGTFKVENYLIRDGVVYDV